MANVTKLSSIVYRATPYGILIPFLKILFDDIEDVDVEICLYNQKVVEDLQNIENEPSMMHPDLLDEFEYYEWLDDPNIIPLYRAAAVMMHCPHCKTLLRKTELNIICLNVHCPRISMARLATGFMRLNILFTNEQLLHSLVYDYEIKTIADFLTASDDLIDALLENNPELKPSIIERLNQIADFLALSEERSGGSLRYFREQLINCLFIRGLHSQYVKMLFDYGDTTTTDGREKIWLDIPATLIDPVKLTQIGIPDSLITDIVDDATQRLDEIYQLYTLTV